MPEFCEPLEPIRQSKFGQLGNNQLFRKKGPPEVTYGFTVTNFTNCALSYPCTLTDHRYCVVT